ncbi:glycosyl transferase family protein [Amorphus sp. MBR-141]
MSPYAPFFVASYYSTLELLIGLVSLIILVSSVDDLFIDAWYWTRRIWRSVTVWRTHKPLEASQILERPEQPIAIMIPAWLEYDVIAPMLENMVNTLDYGTYTIFAGTYRNDERTIAEVERMRRRYGQLVRVEVPHDGPTCKADCLNWIIASIFGYEKTHGIEFAGVVLHDSEDVLHPLELRFFNYLLPRKDLIQIPVTSLERDWYELVAGTYMDEFAEWHAKDLVVRESMSGMVPSAGVGTCFSRRALLLLCERDRNQPFSVESLTEDYDIGVRLSAYGLQGVFCQFPVRYEVSRHTWFGYGRDKRHRIEMPMCVREYFPDTFRTAYRQKARWTLGIALQGWQQIGWRGGLAERYLLFRDRKGLVTSFVSIIAYLLVLQVMVLYFCSLFGIATLRFPTLIEPDGWIAFALKANAVALSLRVIQRMYFVGRIYGWEHALLSAPRMVIGNFINFFAAARAWRLFLANYLFGKKLVWDKTMHDFPSFEQTANRSQRLGELLVSWKAVDARVLTDALVDQAESHLPLGRTLILRGALDEDTLAEAISFQSGLPRCRPTAAMVKAHADVLPQRVCIHCGAVPFGRAADGRVQLAVAGPLSIDHERELAAQLPDGYALNIATESEVTSAIRIVSGIEAPIHDRPVAPLLGELLIETGMISPYDLSAAIDAYDPGRHGKIGAFLVERGLLTSELLAKAVAEQQRLFDESQQTLGAPEQTPAAPKET